MTESQHTYDACVDGVRRFVLFNANRRPRDMGAAEITVFLTHLAIAARYRPRHGTRPRGRCHFLSAGT
ncbi:MAG: phage integrase N-terminal SAM-like domain-containing protein [Acidimicrobiales bacterium]